MQNHDIATCESIDSIENTGILLSYIRVCKSCDKKREIMNHKQIAAHSTLNKF